MAPTARSNSSVEPLEALASSVVRLRRLVEPLTPDQLAASAYPSEWTIAQVLSHLGSSAVIFERRIDDTVRAVDSPAGFERPVWDEWNAKSPRVQAADALRADASLVARLEALSEEERAGFEYHIGPIAFDFAGFVGLRLNEHVLHTWDIEVVLQPAAVLAPDATALVVDNLSLVARYTATPTGHEHVVVVRTSDPTRTFTVGLGTDAVTFTSGEAPRVDASSELRLPAEAFIRLVYGRLDPDHTPPGIEGTHLLDELRKVFPGP